MDPVPANFNITVLVAPLDWGLGHATRCIPLIKYLLLKGCKVVIAAEGSQKSLLEKEFPAVEIVFLKGYRISYSRGKRLLPFKIIQQLPGIIHTITTENKWLKRFVEEQQIDAIISDNRYGVYYYNIHSIFITHQLTVKAPFRWVESLIRRINYQFINRFDECWVPDEAGLLNIGGELSHADRKLQIPLKYLGALSRFSPKQVDSYRYDFLAVISGPEPQRSLLEQLLLAQVQNFRGTGLIVRGVPAAKDVYANEGNITIVNHLDTAALEAAFNESEYIISRSGYTTVMDIIKLRKKSILIPTPGQTEQEYLGRHLLRQQWAYSIDQQHFELQDALSAAQAFTYKLPQLPVSAYTEVLDNFIYSIKK